MEYLLAFDEWGASLSVEGRRMLAGAAAPDLDSHSRCQTARASDASDLPEMSEWPDMAAEVDRDEDDLAEKFGMGIAQARQLAAEISARVQAKVQGIEARLLARIAANFVESPNPKLCAAGLIFAGGLDSIYGFNSMRSWAAANNVSVAAVSKNARWWVRELGLKNTQNCRVPEVCEKYAAAQNANHWRKKL